MTPASQSNANLRESCPRAGWVLRRLTPQAVPMTNTTTTKFATAVTLAAALYYQRRLAYERGRLPGGGSQNERSARPQAHESLSAAARSPKPWLAQSLSRPAAIVEFSVLGRCSR